ncbi:IclR family transcriptional regulator C-terminal domain-containing protein [Streptomyces sp. NPDC047706]|uniref:IclR family transcriptional regulator domain-containing protein n=1 Tax=Streptomyces sp. NPDC047706 TaxID=3365486 RepID=UPI003715D102
MEEVRDQGCALVDEELEEGLPSLAVPVRDRTGHAVAALNTAMHRGDSGRDRGGSACGGAVRIGGSQSAGASALRAAPGPAVGAPAPGARGGARSRGSGARARTAS